MGYKFGICLLVSILFLVHLSDGYKNIRLQDYLCSDKLLIALQKPFRGDPAFTLTEHRDSAAIITQVWNATFPSTHGGANKLKYDCQFRVQTADRPRRGIYTVISKLKFRHDPVTGACLDYIQFLNGNRSPSERICNEISLEGPGRLIFDQRDRDVSVNIHIDKRHVITEPLELRMVLTAHSECRLTNGDFQCDPKDAYSCISKQFVRDNLTNCMFPCRDEVSCFHDAVIAEEMDTTNLALSAITSLIFTMLGVGFCVWVCWKYWNCITVQQRAHEASAATLRRSTAVQRDTPVIELPTAVAYDPITTINPHYSPQQPLHHQPHHQQVALPSFSPPPPATPKDLPPSYESLFPDR